MVDQNLVIAEVATTKAIEEQHFWPAVLAPGGSKMEMRSRDEAIGAGNRTAQVAYCSGPG